MRWGVYSKSISHFGYHKHDTGMSISHFGGYIVSLHKK